MTWESTGSGWRPRLQGGLGADLVDLLHQELKRAPTHKAFEFADNLSVTRELFAKQTKAAVVVVQSDRRLADFLAAFGCESVESAETNKAGLIADTALRTMSGAGHQDFLGTMQKLFEHTTADHLRRALFEAWTYGDPVALHTMRWDPRDDVRRALRWSEPSGDPARESQGAEWGANRLAIEGMPLLPTAPGRKGLNTTGFRRLDGDWCWTWPIWEGPASIDVVRSLLADERLQAERPVRRELAAMGVREVYRCRRVTQGRYRNLTIARAV